jgi:N-acetylmuramoyl-L-alanine amidase
MLRVPRLLRAFCSRSRVTPARQACVGLACGTVLLLSPFLQASFHQLSKLPSFERAERLQEALEAHPGPQRSRLDYEKVLDAYRAVYHGDPASPKADASVFAVAGLLAEEGRLFSDEKLLHDAIGQYEFLRQQYPNTRYRFSALITEGVIYRHDIGDREAAREKFQLFLQIYPQNPLAEQARSELTALHHPSRAARNPVLSAAIGSQQSRPETAVTPPEIQPQQVRPPTPPAQLAAAPDENLPGTSASPAPHPGRVALVSGIRHWSTPVYTRIAIDLQDEVSYEAARVPGPDRIYFDLHGARLDPALNGKSVEVIDDGFLKRIRAAQFSNNVTRIVLDVSSVSDYSAFLLPNPWRLIIDVHGLKAGAAPTTTLTSVPPAPALPAATLPPGKAPASAPAERREIASLGQQPDRVQATDHPTTRPISASVAGTVPAPQADDGSLASTTPPPGRSRKKPSPMHPASPGDEDNPSPPPHEAEPTSAGERSLVRTLGLKIGRIVIDAGHGGHDSGTLGPGGIQEKEVVLDVALRLGKLLKQRLGADVIFTRDSDTFIPLETRTAIANKAQADLFLSIHANSSSDSSARGVETYYLNFTTSPDALEVAARENAVSDESIHELSDLVKKITLKDKIDESREFAADVQKSLYADLEEGNPGLRDRGVKKAPFVVLIGANMPSILAEISFLTNSDDARELQQAAYRQRIAESLYRGVSRYISGLSGVRLAQSAGHPNGN